MLASGSAAEGRNAAFSGVERAAKRRAAKIQTEAQRESRFDQPSVTSATATKRSGHGQRGERADQGPRSGGEVALVTAAEPVRVGCDRDYSFVAVRWKKLDQGRVDLATKWVITKFQLR